MGNTELHLIKGLPTVRSDDDNLIVGHIALKVRDMAALRDRLRRMGISTRKNVSVPYPTEEEGANNPLDQVS